MWGMETGVIMHNQDNKYMITETSYITVTYIKLLQGQLVMKKH